MLTLTLLCGLLSGELSARDHQPRPEAVEWISLAAAETGTDWEVLASLLGHESAGGQLHLVTWCARWELIPGDAAGRVTCRDIRRCDTDCRRPAIWDHRIEVGPWQFRDPPTSVVVDGVRRPVKGFSWLRFRTRVAGVRYEPARALEWEYATQTFVWIVNYLDRTYPPKACGMTEENDGVAAWLSYYAAAGGAGDRKGCDTRAHHLLAAERAHAEDVELPPDEE
jgi:hypothetical protein